MKQKTFDHTKGIELRKQEQLEKEFKEEIKKMLKGSNSGKILFRFDNK